MSLPSVTIAEFLAKSKEQYEQILKDKERPVTFVTGNQSADLDSLCSAILFACGAEKQKDPNAFSPDFIPFVNIPTEDLHLRPEFAEVFSKLDIEPSNLVTLSDLPDVTDSKTRIAPERTNWVLVDHNKLEGDLGEVYGGHVQGVIDHHQDEEAVPASAKLRRIETAGSCSSLVIDHFGDEWEATDLKEMEALAGAAQLALAAILIDTKNLTNESKVEPVDRRAVDWCVERLHAYNADWDRDIFFRDLDEAKKDIGSLPLDGILRKDYKAWKENGIQLGMSSVVKPLTFLGAKADEDFPSLVSHSKWSDFTAKFMQQRGILLWAIMTASVDDQGIFKRELYLQSSTPEAAAAIKRFKTDAAENLQLEPLDIHGIGKSGEAWIQGDTTQTRKQVGPRLREAMRDVDGPPKS